MASHKVPSKEAMYIYFIVYFILTMYISLRLSLFLLWQCHFTATIFVLLLRCLFHCGHVYFVLTKKYIYIYIYIYLWLRWFYFDDEYFIVTNVYNSVTMFLFVLVLIYKYIYIYNNKGTWRQRKFTNSYNHTDVI